MNWIKVKDKLPEEDKRILLLEDDGDIDIGCMIREEEDSGNIRFVWYTDQGDIWRPNEKLFTHWIYLDNIPKPLQ